MPENKKQRFLSHAQKLVSDTVYLSESNIFEARSLFTPHWFLTTQSDAELQEISLVNEALLASQEEPHIMPYSHDTKQPAKAVTTKRKRNTSQSNGDKENQHNEANGETKELIGIKR